MKTVWVVLAEEDGSFIAVCSNEAAALQRSINYEEKYGNECNVYEEELED